MNDTTTPPTHVKNTVDAIAQLHSDHFEDSSFLQKSVEVGISIVARPTAIIVLTLVVLVWVVLNVTCLSAGKTPWDPPPFSVLQCATSLVALYMTLLILVGQRRGNQLAAHREQLTLELAIVAEQKTTKIIQLLEEMRRDSPHLQDRIDEAANSMSAPADPQTVLNTIKDTHKTQEGT